MAVDLPAILTSSLRRHGEIGMVARRLIVVMDLPQPAPGSNARVVDSIQHLNFEDVLSDPGVLGAVAQFAVRKADA